jgi:catechol 2,3-dioxygenase-like lactoylglutathione lyase family enzyme
MVRVTGFDHLVLVVADVEKSLAWYCGFLGLEEVRVEEWRRGDAPFPSARVNDATIIDFVPRGERPAGANVDHICLVVEPTDLSTLGTGGPRFGARGIGTSVYIEDPDGNTVELRYYTGEGAT